MLAVACYLFKQLINYHIQGSELCNHFWIFFSSRGNHSVLGYRSTGCAISCSSKNFQHQFFPLPSHKYKIKAVNKLPFFLLFICLNLSKIFCLNLSKTFFCICFYRQWTHQIASYEHIPTSVFPGGLPEFSALTPSPGIVGACSRVVELGSSMWVIIGSNPNETELTFTTMRSLYRFSSHIVETQYFDLYISYTLLSLYTRLFHSFGMRYNMVSIV